MASPSEGFTEDMRQSGVEAIGLWKQFRRGELHDSLRDLFPAIGHKLIGRGSKERPPEEAFWALRDVNFQVDPGQALGVIGPNGAGKSTLLKVLTKILRPTRGECTLNGRVGALIEIAAGFHPDLTGRENVFLQGAIMGMRRAEIAERFDQIVDFAGVSEFIDTPVKRYSSGMNARLGFAIAAHLQPDVLIIDEVLAVGDFQFQERAFGKIREIVGEGVPVVVVSHQLDRVASLCTHAMLLDRGRVIRQGTPAECIEAYVLSGTREQPAAPDHPIQLESLDTWPTGELPSGSNVNIAIQGRIAAPVKGHEVVEVRVRALQTGQLIYATSSDRLGVTLPEAGPFRLATELQLNVPPGVYAVETVVYDQRRQRVAAPGPYCTVQIQGGVSFWGVVQLNARMSLEVPELTRVAV